MSMSQGEAVFQAVSNTLGNIDGQANPSKGQLEAIYERVFNMFQTGQVNHSKNPTPEQLKKYIPGLVNNWLRKDKRLNGGTTYQAKNPGSRSGSGDESVRAMRQLLAATTDPDAKLAIQAEIDKRIASLKPQSSPINPALLPENLRHLVG